MRDLRLIGLLAALLVVPAASAQARCVSQFTQGITRNGFSDAIVEGPDGNIWFAEGNPLGVNRIGRITPGGAVTEFSSGISLNADITAITSGPDGNLWFAEDLGNRIGRITPSGVVTEFSSGISGGAGPTSIAAGPDGNIWFAELTANRIGRITPTGQVSEFPTGATAQNNAPSSITAGPDGNLWFVDNNGIGRMTPAGVVTRFNEIGYYEFGREITSGPDGNLWVTDGNKIARITPSGQLTEFSQGISGADGTNGITAGPDGNVWFVDKNGIERITPGGHATNVFRGTISGHFPVGSIAAGPAGTLWFTEGGKTSAIGRILPSGSCPIVRIKPRRARVSSAGTVTLSLSCGRGAVGCVGTLTLTAHVRHGRRFRSITIGSADYSIPVQQRSSIALRLTPRGLKLLRKAPDHRLSVTARTPNAHRKVTLVRR